MQTPVGPVAVFGASNFPFAFSVLGGDVASALAAGCPVVVKAHPLHAGTAEVSARLVTEALRERQLPAEAFSLLQGETVEVGEELVTSSAITAVAFTGSLRVGRSLYDLASRRKIPIPVYAEMGSINPVFVTDGTLEGRFDTFVSAFVTSMTMGGGQFCTKPGLLVVPEAWRGEVLNEVSSLLGAVQPPPMLGASLLDNLVAQVAKSVSTPGVREVARISAHGMIGLHSDIVVVTTSEETLRTQSHTLEEHFGPFVVVVGADSIATMGRIAGSLPGSLTASIHCEPDEVESCGELAGILENKVGRLIWNGMPTGVSVARAMQHGGPYPASTFAEHTSVGTFAVRRWMRPICFQSCPDAALPPALQSLNPLGLRRLVDGEWTTDAIK